MTCPNCGAPVAENRRFCGKCGAALTTSPPAGPPPSPIAPTGGAASPWGATSSPPPPPPPARPSGPADPYAPPDLGAPPGWAAPPYQTASYPPPGAPPYPPPGPPGTWPGPAAPYGYAPPHTNGLAITSLVLGLAGWLLCGVGSVVAIVLGFVARDQIKRSWGRQTGSGMATAGIILGFIGAAFWLVALIVQIVNSANTVR